GRARSSAHGVSRAHPRRQGRGLRWHGQNNRNLVEAALGRRARRKRKRSASDPRRGKGVDPYMTEAALRLIEEQSQRHYSVMAREVVAALAPQRGDIFVD